MYKFSINLVHSKLEYIIILIILTLGIARKCHWIGVIFLFLCILLKILLLLLYLKAIYTKILQVHIVIFLYHGSLLCALLKHCLNLFFIFFFFRIGIWEIVAKSSIFPSNLLNTQHFFLGFFIGHSFNHHYLRTDFAMCQLSLNMFVELIMAEHSLRSILSQDELLLLLA